MAFFQKIIVLVLILSIVASSAPFLFIPNRAEASLPTHCSVVDYICLIKEGFGGFGLDFVWRTITSFLIRFLTDSIVGWIQGNGGANVGFVGNFEDEFRRQLDGRAGQFLNQLLGTNLCGNIGGSLRGGGLQMNLRTNPGFRDYFSCTLTDIVDNVDDFFTDFSNGGWAAFMRTALVPKNNPYGAFFIAFDKKIEAESSVSKSVERNILSNIGFKGVQVEEKRCLDGPVRTLPKGVDEVFAEETENGFQICYIEHVTKTPGSLVADMLNRSLGVSYDFAVNSDEINEAINAIITALINKLISSTLEGIFDPGLVGLPASGTPTPKDKEAGYCLIQSAPGATPFFRCPKITCGACAAIPGSLACVQDFVPTKCGGDGGIVWDVNPQSIELGETAQIIYHTDGISPSACSARAVPIDPPDIQTVFDQSIPNNEGGIILLEDFLREGPHIYTLICSAITKSVTLEVGSVTPASCPLVTRVDVVAPLSGWRIFTPSISPGEVGVPYCDLIEAQGGEAPLDPASPSFYTQELIGELPPGLVLTMWSERADIGGALIFSIKGTPTVAGTYTFTARVSTPPFGVTNPSSDTKDFSILITEPAVSPPPSSPLSEDGCVYPGAKGSGESCKVNTECCYGSCFDPDGQTDPLVGTCSGPLGFQDEEGACDNSVTNGSCATGLECVNNVCVTPAQTLQTQSSFQQAATSTATSTKPIITFLGPSAGPIGTQITLMGTNLTTQDKVYFGGHHATTGRSRNGILTFSVPETHCTEIITPKQNCAVPSPNRGDYYVSVINSNGTSNSLIFTVTN